MFKGILHFGVFFFFFTCWNFAKCWRNAEGNKWGWKPWSVCSILLCGWEKRKKLQVIGLWLDLISSLIHSLSERCFYMLSCKCRKCGPFPGTKYSPTPGRTVPPLKLWLLEFVVVVQSLSCVRCFATQWTASHQAYLSLRVCSNSGLLSWWCQPTISPSIAPFSSCPQSFPASGSWHDPVTLQWVGSSHQAAKVLELQHQSFQCILRVDFF